MLDLIILPCFNYSGQKWVGSKLNGGVGFGFACPALESGLVWLDWIGLDWDRLGFISNPDWFEAGWVGLCSLDRLGGMGSDVLGLGLLGLGEFG